MLGGVSPGLIVWDGLSASVAIVTSKLHFIWGGPPRVLVIPACVDAVESLGYLDP